MNTLGLTIVSLLVGVVIFLIIDTICGVNKIKKKFKKDVEELKIGNKYKMKEFFLRNDNPFNSTTFIVEIVDVKFNYKNELYVQYKQIEPELKDELFSSSFNKFMDVYDLIKYKIYDKTRRNIK